MGPSLIAPLDAQEVIDHMLDAFALHEILLDPQGQPTDYVFLAVNSAFENMRMEVLNTRDFIFTNQNIKKNEEASHRLIVPIIDKDEIVFLCGITSNRTIFTKDVALNLRNFFTEIWHHVVQKRLEAENNALQEQFLQAQRLENLGMQSGIIAHDFNNLLAAILGKINLAFLKMAPGSPVIKELQEAKDIINQGKDLTAQLLAFAEKDSLELKPLDLMKLTTNFIPLIRSSIPRNIEIDFSTTADEDFTIVGDDGRLRQVIMNLITNASDAIEEHNGRIVIRLEKGDFRTDDFLPSLLLPPPEGSYIKLSIEDNGPGMTELTQKNSSNPSSQPSRLATV